MEPCEDRKALSHDEQTQKLMAWEGRLKRIENRLRQLFPSEIDNLLKETTADIPTIYAITPTYARPVQKAELIRLANTFLHVPNFHWILVEDSSVKTQLVKNFLATCGLKYTHLNVATPPEWKLKSTDPNWLKPRGVLQRNAGISWLRENSRNNEKIENRGVIYFADDDNTYSLQLFEEVSLCGNRIII